MQVTARGKTSWGRAVVLATALAVLTNAASCGSTAGDAQRTEQASAAVTTALPRAHAPHGDTPTQMWIDDGAGVDRVVIVRTGHHLASYDATTLAEHWRSDAAVLSADRRTAVATTPAASGTGTTLTVIDIRTGETRRTIELGQLRDVVAVSTNGTRAALVDTLTLDPETGMPLGRELSLIDVLDLATGAIVTQFELHGNFVPEAFDSSSGLAIVEYVPTAAPERYRVRTLDLKSGNVTNVLTRDKTEIVDEMQGYGRAAVAATDGAALFTLYRDGGRWGSAFVHQLVGQGQFAFCVDLPEVGFDDATAIALSPDNRDLYVAGAKGAVAVIDAQVNFGVSPVAVRSVLWVPGVVGTPTAIAVTSDTIWLLVDGQLVTAQRSSGERVATRPAGDATGIGTSADGRAQVLADDHGGVRLP
jgi:hypothetical protein